MVSDRPYRGGRSTAEALDELRKHAGTQFDPAVVEAFEQAVRDTARPVAPASAPEHAPEIRKAARPGQASGRAAI